MGWRTKLPTILHDQQSKLTVFYCLLCENRRAQLDSFAGKNWDPRIANKMKVDAAQRLSEPRAQNRADKTQKENDPASPSRKIGRLRR
jgi:hypothetical protein